MFADLIHILPKAELHLHLEGSIQPVLALQLAQKHHRHLPGMQEGVAGLRQSYHFSSFADFVNLYLAISACLVDADDFTAIVGDLGRALAKQNIRYAEVTFTPMTHIARGVSADAMLAGLFAGCEQAREQFGVEIAWVFDIVRSLFDQATPTLELALREQKRGVIGLGFAGPEGPQWPSKPFEPIFARARAHGLRSLPHAGEQWGAESIWGALRDLGADRIGHGVRCLEDPTLVEYLAEHRIPLEICPSSNVGIGLFANLASHPLPQLLAAGLEISLASDDPPLFHTDLCQEYQRCAATFSWDEQQIFHLAQAAVRHSFLSTQAKENLLAEQQECFTKWQQIVLDGCSNHSSF